MTLGGKRKERNNKAKKSKGKAALRKRVRMGANGGKATLRRDDLSLTFPTNPSAPPPLFSTPAPPPSSIIKYLKKGGQTVEKAKT